VFSLPETGLFPDHAPEATHAVAPVVLQFNVAGLPGTTAEGFAENVRTGGGGVVERLRPNDPNPACVETRVMKLKK
jgi:hypothetical protein